ncbi:metallopeptidase TldD-related protein [Bdellovibrio sp. HCB337]|uniref:metallopeptidase TldD-related protein n=1 Tax=Bdellovibrio sp. HCB337 TaxID=3394358 RepID=UPI0039A47AF5
MQHDLLKIHKDMTALKIQGNKISGLQTQKIQKSAARVFKGGQVYSSAFVGSIDDQALLGKAEHAGNVGIAYDYALPKTAGFESTHIAKESRGSALNRFKDFFHDLQKQYPHLYWSGHANFTKSTRYFTSSYTGNLHTSGETVEATLLYKQFGSADFAEGWMFIDGPDYDFNKFYAKAEPLLKAVGQKAAIDSKKMPVLLMDNWSFMERIAQDMKPEKFHAGSTALSGKLGEQVFNSQVSFQDVSLNPAKGRFRGFDGEGVLHTNPMVFENGTFSKVLYDLRQATKANTQSTGNGLRSFNTGVNCGVHELVLAPGKTPVWEMIKSLPECLVVAMSYGGTITEQWEYSYPVQVGFLFRHGQPVGRVPSVSVKGLFKDILGKDLIAISSDSFSGSFSPCVLTQMEVVGH